MEACWRFQRDDGTAFYKREATYILDSTSPQAGVAMYMAMPRTYTIPKHVRFGIRTLFQALYCITDIDRVMQSDVKLYRVDVPSMHLLDMHQVHFDPVWAHYRIVPHLEGLYYQWRDTVEQGDRNWLWDHPDLSKYEVFDDPYQFNQKDWKYKWEGNKLIHYLEGG